MLNFIVPIVLSVSFMGQTETWIPMNCRDYTLNGYYEEGKIYICPHLLQDKELYRNTYVHEYGHYLYEKLTDKQRAYWESLYDNSYRFNFVSAYARQNSLEDFAETFAYVLIDKKDYIDRDSKNLQKKLKFMRLVVDKIIKK